MTQIPEKNRTPPKFSNSKSIFHVYHHFLVEEGTVASSTRRPKWGGQEQQQGSLLLLLLLNSEGTDHSHFVKNEEEFRDRILRVGFLEFARDVLLNTLGGKRCRVVEDFWTRMQTEQRRDGWTVDRSVGQFRLASLKGYSITPGFLERDVRPRNATDIQQDDDDDDDGVVCQLVKIFNRSDNKGAHERRRLSTMCPCNLKWLVSQAASSLNNSRSA